VTTQLYDPFNMPHAQGNLQLGLQTDGEAFYGRAVISGTLAYFGGGGGTMYVYNTASNSTQVAPEMPPGTWGYGMTLLNNSDVLVCGGAGTNACWLYTVGANAWTSFASLPMTELYNFAMVTLDGRPYVFGGVNSTQTFNTVYTFDANMWTARTPMRVALHAHSAVALGTDTALVCGGTTSGGSSVQSACYSYAALKDVWTSAAQLNTARAGHGMCVYKDRVLVYGGGNGPNTLSSVEMLSADGLTWQTQPTAMFAPVEYFASVPLP